MRAILLLFLLLLSIHATTSFTAPYYARVNLRNQSSAVGASASLISLSGTNATTKTAAAMKVGAASAYKVTPPEQELSNNAATYISGVVVADSLLGYVGLSGLVNDQFVEWQYTVASRVNFGNGSSTFYSPLYSTYVDHFNSYSSGGTLVVGRELWWFNWHHNNVIIDGEVSSYVPYLNMCVLGTDSCSRKVTAFPVIKMVVPSGKKFSIAPGFDPTTSVLYSTGEGTVTMSQGYFNFEQRILDTVMTFNDDYEMTRKYEVLVPASLANTADAAYRSHVASRDYFCIDSPQNTAVNYHKCYFIPSGAFKRYYMGSTTTVSLRIITGVNSLLSITARAAVCAKSTQGMFDWTYESITKLQSFALPTSFHKGLANTLVAPNITAPYLLVDRGVLHYFEVSDNKMKLMRTRITTAQTLVTLPSFDLGSWRAPSPNTLTNSEMPMTLTSLKWSGPTHKGQYGVAVLSSTYGPTYEYSKLPANHCGGNYGYVEDTGICQEVSAFPVSLSGLKKTTPGKASSTLTIKPTKQITMAVKLTFTCNTDSDAQNFSLTAGSTTFTRSGKTHSTTITSKTYSADSTNTVNITVTFFGGIGKRPSTLCRLEATPEVSNPALHHDAWRKLSTAPVSVVASEFNFVCPINSTISATDPWGYCATNSGFYGKVLASTTATTGVIKPCDPGHYCTNGNRTQCDTGYYAPKSQLSACLKCPANTMSGNSPTFHSLGSIKCTLQAGYWLESGTVDPVSFPVIHPCPKGYSCEGGSQTKAPCLTATYADSEGLTRCKPCSDNGKFTANDEGLYIPTGATQCLSCPAGAGCRGGTLTACNTTKLEYQSLEGQNECFICGNSESNRHALRYSPTECVFCAEGEVSYDGQCVACTDDGFKNAESLYNSGYCTTMTTQFGSVDSLQETTISVLHLCPASSYRPGGSRAECNDCTSQLSPFEGNRDTTGTKAFTECKFCPVSSDPTQNYYKKDNSCHLCGESESALCTLNEYKGKHFNSIVNCTENEYIVEVEKIASCVLCSLKYPDERNTLDTDRTCEYCPSHQYWTPGDCETCAGACIDCPAINSSTEQGDTAYCRKLQDADKTLRKLDTCTKLGVNAAGGHYIVNNDACLECNIDYEHRDLTNPITTCQYCPAGSFWDAAAGKCVECISLTVVDSSAQIGEAAYCRTMKDSEGRTYQVRETCNLDAQNYISGTVNDSKCLFCGRNHGQLLSQTDESGRAGRAYTCVGCTKSQYYDAEADTCVECGSLMTEDDLWTDYCAVVTDMGGRVVRVKRSCNGIGETHYIQFEAEFGATKCTECPLKHKEHLDVNASQECGDLVFTGARYSCSYCPIGQYLDNDEGQCHDCSALDSYNYCERPDPQEPGLYIRSVCADNNGNTSSDYYLSTDDNYSYKCQTCSKTLTEYRVGDLARSCEYCSFSDFSESFSEYLLTDDEGNKTCHPCMFEPTDPRSCKRFLDENDNPYYKVVDCGAGHYRSSFNRCESCATDYVCAGGAQTPVWEFRFCFDLRIRSGVISTLIVVVAVVVGAGGVLAGVGYWLGSRKRKVVPVQPIEMVETIVI